MDKSERLVKRCARVARRAWLKAGYPDPWIAVATAVLAEAGIAVPPSQQPAEESRG